MTYSSNRIKSDVVFYGLKPEMVFCNQFILAVFNYHSVPCVPTSIVGKKHGLGSLHPPGYAIDYRTRHIEGANRKKVIEALITDLKHALPCCDVLFEHESEAQEHIHIEYDPKDDGDFISAKALYKKTGVWPNRVY